MVKQYSIAAIRKVIESGATATEAPVLLGISSGTLRRLMSSNGLQFKARKRDHKRQDKIIAAVASGVETSAEIAVIIGTTRAQMSVELHHIAERGFIERVPSKGGGRGRGLLRWRVKA